jgi:hypothetical protein
MAAIIVNPQDKLLTFLTRHDVEPTSNVSERALRPSVIFRKDIPDSCQAMEQSMLGIEGETVAVGRLGDVARNEPCVPPVPQEVCAVPIGVEPIGGRRWEETDDHQLVAGRVI